MKIGVVVFDVDVKNINLQIKSIKTCFFFTFIKTLKNMHKNIKLYSIQYPFK